MSQFVPDSGRNTIPRILEQSSNGKILTAVTAYDFTSALLIDQTDIDIVLIGDSVASVIQGRGNTLPVTLDEMIYHSKCVARGISKALLVCDLPFLSYQVSPEEALRSAGRVFKESEVHAVKLEGGKVMADTVRYITERDMPVMGHIGLTPQSYHRMGGHRIQGKSAKYGVTSAEELVEDALTLQDAGVFSVVLEGIPSELAARITEMLDIPTIGIGAGSECSGQILVLHDLLGLSQGTPPKFVRRFAELGQESVSALNEYVKAVSEKTFPSASESYSASSHKMPRIKAVS